MQFVFDGKFYKAIKITGPTHNLLGLVFGKDKDHDIETIALKSKIYEKDNIDPLDVKNQVVSGVEAVNHELGIKYTVEKIQYISSDTPSDTVYKELAIEIIKRLIAGGEFTKI